MHLRDKISEVRMALEALNADDDPDGTEALIEQRDEALGLAGTALEALTTVSSELAALHAFIEGEGASAADDCEQTYATLGRLGFKVS